MQSGCGRTVGERHEGHFLTDLLPGEMDEFAAWSGLRVPTVRQWRAAGAWLREQKAVMPPESIRDRLHPAARVLWRGLFHQLRPKTLLDLSLMTGGVVEWVRDGDGMVGLGKPYPAFHKVLINPMQGAPIRPIRRKERPQRRLHYFGARFMR